MDLKKEGKTILLTSHNSEDICVLADVVWEMDGGFLKAGVSKLCLTKE